jgi:hypothetical protein
MEFRSWGGVSVPTLEVTRSIVNALNARSLASAYEDGVRFEVTSAGSWPMILDTFTGKLLYPANLMDWTWPHPGGCN